MQTLDDGRATIASKRRMVADFCKMLGRSLPDAGKPQSNPAPGMNGSLPPRLRQTLERLLAGDSEKQVAARLGLSRHTVHIHVKRLYRAYKVNSRGELLARCLGRAATPAAATHDLLK
jgi:DNA-binding NarL/FixJ family response regulator